MKKSVGPTARQTEIYNAVQAEFKKGTPIKASCEKANVSTGTYYNAKSAFEGKRTTGKATAKTTVKKGRPVGSHKKTITKTEKASDIYKANLKAKISKIIDRYL